MLRAHERDPHAEPISASALWYTIFGALAARAVLFVSAAVPLPDLPALSLGPGALDESRPVVVEGSGFV